ncbi:MAG: peptidoglycan DD-metalloendopeptidase family protein [Candidatus Paceibacterota bacterium]|jgi:hypothetical protein
MKRLSKFSLLVILLVFLLPNLSFAKNDLYSFSKDRATKISASLENTEIDKTGFITESDLTVIGDKTILAEIDLYKKMAIIRISPARPWRILPKPKEISVTFSGLVPKTTYYLYKEKLRDPEIFTADETGTYTIKNLPTPRHRYLILKTTPSTYHLDTNSSTGGDCTQIGTWNATTNTCTLSPTAIINETIEIDDGGITLDGAGRTINHFGSIGIYANENIFENMVNVTVKNLQVMSMDVGVSIIDISGVVLEDITTSATTGISLKDDTDVSVRNVSFLNNNIGFTTTNGQNIVLYRNNFKNNGSDLGIIDGSLVLNNGATLRGNWWSKNNSCVQSQTNPSHCTDSYPAGSGYTDTLPWACENGWITPCSPPLPLVEQMIQPVLETEGTLDCNFPSYIRYLKDSDGTYLKNPDGTIKFKTHKGIDISKINILGKNVRAAASGTVRIAYNAIHPDAGRYIDIFHENVKKLDGTIEFRIFSRYLHLNSISSSLKAGDKVNRGDIIGTVGSTGHSTGPHLHFEIRKGPENSASILSLPVINPQFFVEYPVAQATTMCTIFRSPVDITIIDPDGLRINKDINEIGDNARYRSIAYSVDNDVVDPDEYKLFIIDNRKIGEYKIVVTPESGAALDDIYSARVFSGEAEIILANKVPIANIPGMPYLIFSTENGIQENDNGGNPPNSDNPTLELKVTPRVLNLKSNGVLTAHITALDGDIKQIVAESIKLNGKNPKLFNISDNSLEIKFYREDFIQSSLGTITFKVIGNFKDNSQFNLQDTIKIIKPGK